jgi:GT2 family glycosyltransferase
VICVAHKGETAFELLKFVSSAQVPFGTYVKGVYGSDVAMQREMLVEMAMSNPSIGWVLFVDTDQVPEDTDADLVIKMLKHNVPIVSGLIYQKAYPFHTHAFSSTKPPRRVKRSEAVGAEILQVAAVGTGCLLIRREVFESVPRPWFACGQMDPRLMQEDIFFTSRASELGFPVVLDCGLRIGHKITMTMWPGADGRVWLQLPGAEDLRLPLPILEE